MRRWIKVGCALLLGVGVAGCAMEEMLETDGGDGGRPPDMDVGADAGRCESGIEWRGECLGEVPEVRAEVCAFVAALEAGCEDLDGDCFPGACEGELPAALWSAIGDCDDQRTATHPGAVETCDGQDEDCNGRADDGFEGIGDECDGCGGVGKRECAFDDVTRLTCSTNPGQSAAPPIVPEVCDGRDDDCDGRVDEDCRVLEVGRDASEVKICGDRLLVVQDGVLSVVSRVADGFESQVVDPGPGVAHLSCDAAGAAWLQTSAEGRCASPDGLLRCEPALLRAVRFGGEVRSLTGYGSLGAPRVHGGWIYWHAVLASGPLAQRMPLEGGGVEPLFSGEALSDPVANDDGLLSGRLWGEAGRDVVLRALEGDTQWTVRGSPAPPRAPVLSGTWLAWSTEAEDAGLWVVPIVSPRDGFQLTRGTGPHRAPVLDGDTLHWLDHGGASPTLRWFDLSSGEEGTSAVTMAPVSFDARGGVLAWLAEFEGHIEVFLSDGEGF